MTDIVPTPARLPRWLHAAALAAAAAQGVSLNKFIVAAITRAVSDATPAKSTSGHSSYEMTIRFEIPGRAADPQAYEVLDQASAATTIAGGAVSATSISRLAAMQPRPRTEGSQ
jgi:hypothetical protein